MYVNAPNPVGQLTPYCVAAGQPNSDTWMQLLRLQSCPKDTPLWNNKRPINVQVKQAVWNQSAYYLYRGTMQ
jgi:hypothetical protein